MECVLRPPATAFALSAATLILLAGCGQAGKHPPAAPGAEPIAVTPPLPLPVPPNQDIQPLAPIPQPKSGLESLIAEVEAAFQAGEQNYKSGHLEKARRDFDRAVDLLLSSGFDLHSDPRLDQLFDRIVTTIHAYEVASFREGDGFTEQRAEPAAIDEIAELNFPVDPGLKVKAERELENLPHDLPLTVNDQVLSYMNFFQTPRGRAIIENGLRRGGQYQEMIARIFGEEGLPQDLIYVAQAESAFQPLALSRAGARGIWQFMSFRGRQYGLHRTWWVDDRLDPEKSTRAAARHLKDLYDEFGDWYLVLAAYNSGPGTVTRAIQRTGYADFWELYNRNVLPKETKNYVPIILALTLMAKDAGRYGIEVASQPPVRVDRLRPGHPIDLRLVAETIDVDVESLRALNPRLLRLVTPADPTFELSLPAGTADRLTAEIAAIPPEKWVSWRRHRVEEGETLSQLAHKYRVTLSAIADANGLSPDSELHVGDKLIIPAVAPRAEQGKLVRYRVRRGDTLESIAEQFDVSVASLKRWNHISGNRIGRGTSLKIYPGGIVPASPARPARAAKSKSTKPPAPTPGAVAGASTMVHKVKKGETLSSIARAHRTTIEALRAANKFLADREIRPGDLLAILPPR